MSLVNQFEKLLQCIEEEKDLFEIPFLQEIVDSNKVRIHGNGLDTSGVKIGLKGGSKYSKRPRYSPRHEKKRIKIGRRVSPIDLYINGDFSNSQKVLKTDEGENGIGFSNDLDFNGLKAWELAEAHEKTYNTEIFNPSEEQIDDALEHVLKFELEKVIELCYDKIQ